MTHLKHAIFLFLSLGATSIVHAAEDNSRAIALSNRSACMACHAVERKMVGPSYKDVAAKYAGDAAAPDRLAKKIKSGSSGVWGSVPMPPQPSLSDADVRVLADWVLAGAPSK
ncbi:c-type cytochrome [Herminiimonas fonticola]|uniref:Cytochrome c n=1 Tax=Herminiimonas fonticola TaxID=303380 RepID=A0A4R6G110_9BURK|nr:c-type cytochrome [Herminiimonas fonticola]RBA23603.1 Cytochrome c551/c552 [Herminiimonas fonticola]TDN88009.1 cytochrome c [Herminiimonas fonticola]